jgi:CheY-like chemotaxis protein
VDDQSDNRELLVRMLMPLRLEIREATNGQQGIACCQEWHPDLILLDLYMPTLSGFTTAQQIRQLEDQASAAKTGQSRPPTKIIALSASVLEEDCQKAFAAGCNGFLTKPFQPNDLYEILAQQLDLQYRYADPKLKAESKYALTLDRTIGGPISQTPATPVLLNFMSSEWCAQLYQATLCCRDEHVIELLEQIPLEHQDLTQQLRSYAQNFQFEMILKFLPGYSREDQI